jgi:hypothetical protein
LAAKTALGRVDGTDELIRRMKAILKIVNKEMGRINRENAERGADRARQLVPYDTGALAESITIRGQGSTWRFGSFARENVNETRAFTMVAVWVEYGARKIPAHPYLRPASEFARALVPKDTKTFARELPFLVKNV